MMRHFIGTACVGLALLGSPVSADPDPVVVLELYTSQGCSSCPPADALLGDLSENNDDVLALSFHVDYWDYIGWPDTFADPSHSQRQKIYAHRFEQRMIYTPQLVIQGQTAVVGHKAKQIEAAIEDIRATPAPVRLQLARSGEMLTIAMAPTGAPVGKSDIQLIRYLPEATVHIGRGENSGRRLDYTNVVMSWNVVGMWNGTQPRELTIPLMGEMPAAVLVQEKGQGEVLAAAALR